MVAEAAPPPPPGKGDQHPLIIVRETTRCLPGEVLKVAQDSDPIIRPLAAADLLLITLPDRIPEEATIHPHQSPPDHLPAAHPLEDHLPVQRIPDPAVAHQPAGEDK